MRHPSVILSLAMIAGTSAAQPPDLYDESVLRTVELSFAHADWWAQLTANYGTGTDLAADMTVNGVTYANVGVRFKGNSSYALTGNSQKKSFNVSMDAFVTGQELYGYDTLNLNNSFQDPTFCREVAYFRVCRDFTARSQGELRQADHQR
jgi:spore coat protein CotH